MSTADSSSAAPVPQEREKVAPEREESRYGSIMASRYLCAMSAFAFVSFGFVDPYLIGDGDLIPLIMVRAGFTLLAVTLLVTTFSKWGLAHSGIPGELAALATGVGVIVLTDLTGGASSLYWTMLMLTYFTMALVLPLTPLRAGLYFAGLTIFFDVWMVLSGSQGDSSVWVTVNAGLWLSAFVSTCAVAFLFQSRVREGRYERELTAANRSLRGEIAARGRIEARTRTVEQELRQAQKLDGLGQLAAGVSHELNNVLTSIMGTAELLGLEDKHSATSLRSIVEAAERGARLTSDLLQFSRRGPKMRKTFPVERVVREVVELVRRTHRGRHEVALDCRDLGVQIEGDPQLLYQAFLNLCLNGIDAMETTGGDLRIRLRTSLSRDLPKLGNSSRRPHVVFEVEDQGCGMTPEQSSRAFEPFFTTKPVGKGTGLGLSMVYGIARDHGGGVHIDSTPGKGTIVRVYLPVAGQPSDLPLAFTGAVRGLDSSESLTVLLVEDESMVRGIVSDILSREGYTVLKAEDGVEALEMLGATERLPDLVILDMMMPRMDGAETFRAIRDISDTLPVLLCSGYTQGEMVSALTHSRTCSFIRKPFGAAAILEAVKELLNASKT